MLCTQIIKCLNDIDCPARKGMIVLCTGFEDTIIECDAIKLDDYFSKCFEYLCEGLGADKHTICLAPTNADTKGKYSNTFEIPFGNFTYVRKVYLYYDKDQSDIIFKIVIDWICQYIVNKILLCGNNQFGFYDSVFGNYMSPYDLARGIHENVQKYYFHFASYVLKVDFENLLSLSEMFYESQTANGSIAFLPNSIKCNNQHINIGLAFNQRIVFSNENLNYIRKLLAGSGVANTLLFTMDNDGSYICQGYIKKDKLPCVVSFNGRSSLSVQLYGKNLFHVKNRKLTCNQDKLGIYIDDIYDTFKMKHSYRACREIITKISEQKHGTSILFIDDTCSGHFDYLFDKNRAVKTEYVDSKTWRKAGNTSLLEMTRVDGATVIGISRPKGRRTASIKYTNVIVDVMSVVSACPEFGARHNAIICQMDNLLKEHPKAKIAALIFSESGKVTYVKGSERSSIIGNGSDPISAPPPSPLPNPRPKPKQTCLSTK